MFSYWPARSLPPRQDDSPAAPDGDQMPQPFVNPKVEGSTLTYELFEDDGERMKFEFRLTAERKAELRFVGAPIVIKPIRFDRR